MCIHWLHSRLSGWLLNVLQGQTWRPRWSDTIPCTSPTVNGEIPGDRIHVILLEYIVGKTLSGIPRCERGEDQVVDKVLLDGLKKLNQNGV